MQWLGDVGPGQTCEGVDHYGMSCVRWKYCCVMTLAICDMQCEDVKAELLFSKNLNVVAA